MKHLLLKTIVIVVLGTTAFASPTHNAAKTVDLAGAPAALCPD